MKLQSHILRTPPLPLPTGVANGYVSLPDDHPCYNMDYNHIPVDVHGGLTFAHILDADQCKRMGFPESFAGTYVVGFDTCHAWDTPETCDIDYVRQQTESLRIQLESIYNNAQSLLDQLNTKTNNDGTQ